MAAQSYEDTSASISDGGTHSKTWLTRCGNDLHHLFSPLSSTVYILFLDFLCTAEVRRTGLFTFSTLLRPTDSEFLEQKQAYEASSRNSRKELLLPIQVLINKLCSIFSTCSFCSSMPSLRYPSLLPLRIC